MICLQLYVTRIRIIPLYGTFDISNVTCRLGVNGAVATDTPTKSRIIRARRKHQYDAMLRKWQRYVVYVHDEEALILFPIFPSLLLLLLLYVMFFENNEDVV